VKAELPECASAEGTVTMDSYDIYVATRIDQNMVL